MTSSSPRSGERAKLACVQCHLRKVCKAVTQLQQPSQLTGRPGQM